MNSSLYIGKSYNLLEEFTFYENEKLSKENALEVPLNISHAVSVSNTEIAWDTICLSLLSSQEALIEYLGPFESPPSTYDGDGYSLSPHLLTHQTIEEQFQVLSQQFDFKFNIDSKYIVLELRRQDHTMYHEVFKHAGKATFNRKKHLSKPWDFDSLKLRPGKNIAYQEEFDTVLPWEKAQKYIDSMYKYGTHFISEIIRGDRIIQFFEIKPSSLARIQNIYNDINNGLPLRGREASLFNVLLVKENCLNISPILSVAKDERIGDVIENGLFRQSTTGESSLISASNWDIETIKINLKDLSKATETRVILRPLCRFMGYFRAMNYDRIMKGALAQKWNAKVAFSTRRLRNVTRNLQRLGHFPNTEFHSGETSFQFGDLMDKINPKEHGDQIDLAVYRVISIKGEQQDIDLSQNVFISQFLEASQNTLSAIKITVRDEQFIDPQITCSTMYGCFFLANAKTKEENLIYDGYRFSKTLCTKSGKHKICVNGCLHNFSTRSETLLKHFTTLCTTILSQTILSQQTDTWCKNRLKEYANWLSEVFERINDQETMHSNQCTYLSTAAAHEALPSNYTSTKKNILYSISQFLECTKAIERINLSIFNTQSILHNGAVSSELDKALLELSALEKPASHSYQRIVQKLYKEEYKRLEDLKIHSKYYMELLVTKLLNFKILMDSIEIDDLVPYLLFFLSQTTNRKDLFDPKKNHVKDRYEEEKISVARDFTSLLSYIESDHFVYDEMKNRLRKDLMQNESDELIPLINQVNWQKEITKDRFDILLGSIKEILHQDTQDIKDNTIKIDEIIRLYSQLKKTQSLLHQSIRVLSDLALSLHFSTLKNGQKVQPYMSKIAQLNLVISKLSSYRNQMKAYKKHLESTLEHSNKYSEVIL